MKVNNKELRLYNLVRNKNTNTIEFITAIQNREVLEANEIGYAVEEFEPIEINEDWIIKAGFEKVEDYTDDGEYIYWYALEIESIYDYDCIHYLPNDNNQWSIQYSDRPINCKYLHQLQNLYYALCGQELTELYEYAHQKDIYKTPIKEWEHYKTCSNRLNNILRAHQDKLRYIEDVTKDSFQKCRRAGKVCWDEFYELRGY